MLENRRSLIERETQILEICKAETKITHLLFSTNSNYYNLLQITNSLQERNLLERVRLKHTDQRTIYHFKTTPKGINYIDQLKEVLNYGNNRNR
jgi:predicted transcriptional regulator